MKIGALEAGGTKMVCAVGNEEGEILKKITIPTETPRETMPKMLDLNRSRWRLWELAVLAPSIL